MPGTMRTAAQQGDERTNNMNNIMPFMHPNGFSTERNVTVAIMRALNLDETDFRLRDKLIFAGAPWIQAEREAVAESINETKHSIHCTAYGGVGVPFDDERCDCGATSIVGRTMTE
jgi:hypothetical protein